MSEVRQAEKPLGAHARESGHRGSRGEPRPPAAFTLIELLVVIAIIAILASLLVPALSRAKGHSQSVCCLGNLKQLQLAWQMYYDDNNDVLPLNHATGGSWPNWESTTNSWVAGNALADTNDARIQLGTIFPYVPSSAVYRCPVDRSTVLNKPPIPRTRHYSMSACMNGGSVFPSFKKSSEISDPSPTQAFVFIDEHPWTIDGDGWFAPPVLWRWNSFPDARHQNGANLSFADGHTVHWKWSEERTLAITKMKGSYLLGQETEDGDRDLRKLYDCIRH